MSRIKRLTRRLAAETNQRYSIVESRDKEFKYRVYDHGKATHGRFIKGFNNLAILEIAMAKIMNNYKNAEVPPEVAQLSFSDRYSASENALKATKEYSALLRSNVGEK